MFALRQKSEKKIFDLSVDFSLDLLNNSKINNSKYPSKVASSTIQFVSKRVEREMGFSIAEPRAEVYCWSVSNTDPLSIVCTNLVRLRGTTTSNQKGPSVSFIGFQVS